MADPTRPEGDHGGHGEGRPPDLERLITTDDGRTITIADRLVELRRLGHSPVRACNRVGIRIGVLNRWQAEAASGERILAVRYGNQPNATEDPDHALTDHQRLCMTFCARYDQAWAAYISGLHGSLLRLATGGILIEKTTEKYEDGKLVESSTTRSHTLPDRQAIETLLRAAVPEEFGTKVQVDVVDGGRSAAEELADQVDAFILGLEAARAREEA